MLRDYQAKLRDETLRHWQDGCRSVLAVLQTGGGKTVTGVQTALARGGRVAWIVPRRELASQAVEALRRAGEEPGVLVAGMRRGDAEARVQVCTVQTLYAREERPPADVLVWDEAHHATARTYREVREAYPDAVHLGLTATPERQDGSALGDVFGALVVGPGTGDMVRGGWLADCEVWAPSEYRERALAMDPVDAWRRWGRGRASVVYADSVAAAKELAERLRGAGARAAAMWGTMPAKDRTLALEALDGGALDCVVNNQLLTEGWDCPRVKVGIAARGFSAASTMIQSIGRVRRPWHGERALWVDLRGCVHLHGLPDEPREYSLAGRAMRARDDEPIRQCSGCQRWFRPSGERCCPYCGFQAPPRERSRQEIRAEELRVIRETTSTAAKRERWNALMRQARARGYRVEWAAHRFRAIYGHGPGSI